MTLGDLLNSILNFKIIYLLYIVTVPIFGLIAFYYLWDVLSFLSRIFFYDKIKTFNESLTHKNNFSKILLIPYLLLLRIGVYFFAIKSLHNAVFSKTNDG